MLDTGDRLEILVRISGNPPLGLGEVKLRIAEKTAHDEGWRDTGAGVVTLDHASVDAAQREVLEAVKDSEQTTAQVGGIVACRVQALSHTEHRDAFDLGRPQLLRCRTGARLPEGHRPRRVVAITDDEALAAFHRLCRSEGIIPALESSHAVAHAMKLAATMRPDQHLLVNLSGRGDKDIGTVADLSGAEFYCRPSCRGQTVKGGAATQEVTR